MLNERFPEKWDRYSFFSVQGTQSNAVKAQTLVNNLVSGKTAQQVAEEEESVYATGIVVDLEIIEGQYLLKVLLETSADTPADSKNVTDIREFWDYEAWEYLGKTSLEEMLLSENEKIREFALKYREELEQALMPRDLEEYEGRQKLRERLGKATDDEFDKIIDSL